MSPDNLDERDLRWVMRSHVQPFWLETADYLRACRATAWEQGGETRMQACWWSTQLALFGDMDA